MNNRARRRGGRYYRAIFVRASAEEKERIYQRAAQSKMSASRFLVRGALDSRPPPTAEERAELEKMLRLFLRAHDSLSRLLAGARKLKLIGADPDLEAQLQEVLNTLAALIHLLRKRL